MCEYLEEIDGKDGLGKILKIHFFMKKELPQEIISFYEKMIFSK